MSSDLNLIPLSASGTLWLNPSNALTFNGDYARKAIVDDNALLVDFTNTFGLFNTVVGVEVSVAANDFGPLVTDEEGHPVPSWVGLKVALSNDGINPLAGTYYKSVPSGSITSSGAIVTLGGPSDLWGGSITPAMIRDLKLLLKRDGPGDSDGSRNLGIDYEDVTVYYDVGSGSGGTMIRETRKQLSLLCKEVTPGTPVTSGMTQLRRTRFELNAKPEYKENNPGGEKFISDQTLVYEESEGSWEGELDFGESGLLLASLVCTPNVVTINASPAVYRHTYRYDNRYRDTIHTFTLQKGDPRTRVEQAAFAIINSAEYKFEGKSVGASGALIARALDKDQTIGVGVATVQTLTITSTISFKLVYKGQATSTLSEASNAAAIQTALRALGLVASSTELTVTGTGPFVITFGNALAGPFKGEPQPKLEVITVSGAGTAVIAMTTAGGYVKYTQPIVKPKNIDVYLADLYDDLGAGKLEQCFVSSIKIGGRAEPYAVLDSDNGGSFENYTEPESLAVMVDLTHMADDDGMGLFDQSREGTSMWLRLVITGEEITSGFPFKYVIEAPFFIKIKPFTNADGGVYAAAYELKNTFDDTQNEAFKIELDTTVASFG